MIDTYKKKSKGRWIKKFGYAIRGLLISLRDESSLVVHFIVATIVLTLAGVLHNSLSRYDWVILIIVIGIIISMELINTAIECLVDMVAFEYSYNAKKIKDISAAATLILTLVAISIGLIIFIPIIIKAI